MAETEIKLINNRSLCDATAREEIEQLKKDIANKGTSGDVKTILGNIMTIIRAGDIAYTTDISQLANETDKLIASLGTSDDSSGDNSGGDSGEDEPSTPTVTTYTITNLFTNVTSDNNNTSIEENTSYTANLTAKEGYMLNSILVIMGDEDITASVVANGVITIPSVTANVEITAIAIEEQSEATLPTEGLYGYFDLRNPQTTVGSYHTSVEPLQGSGVGSIYLNSTSNATTFNEYGTQGGMSLCNESAYPKEATNMIDMGNEFSICVKHYGGIANVCGHTNRSNISTQYCGLYPKYNKSSGVANVSQVVVQGSHGDNEYHNVDIVVNGETFKFYLDGVLTNTFNGGDYDDFVSWYSKCSLGVWDSKGHVTAVAIYNKALSDIEITEIEAFFKTLEVVA